MAGIFSRALARVKSTLLPVDNRGGGWFSILPQRVLEAFPGAWQQNIEYRDDQLLTFFAVFACITRISQDVSKLCFKLRDYDDKNELYEEASVAAFSPVLAKPNRYQNHIQFKESWMLSKMWRGNAYILKVRDNRNVVTDLYVLNPDRVQVLVTEFGDVYYRLQGDNLSDIPLSGVVVPASEIIHDRMNTFFHPLVGLSPLFASAISASNGLGIQSNSSKFFANGSVPGGLLEYPGELPDSDARELKQYWQDNYTGRNAGKIAVLTAGMKYTPLKMSAVDSQLIQQLEMTATMVCSTFHVPPYKINIGEMPAHQTLEALNLQYYEECLQFHVESMEQGMDDGLGIGQANNSTYGVWINVADLARMDTAAQGTMAANLVKSGIMSPNEARAQFNLPPVKGGEKPFMQQQWYPLDDRPLPGAVAPPSPGGEGEEDDGTQPATLPAPKPKPNSPNQAANDDVAAAFLVEITKGFAAQ